MPRVSKNPSYLAGKADAEAGVKGCSTGHPSNQSYWDGYIKTQKKLGTHARTNHRKHTSDPRNPVARCVNRNCVHEILVTLGLRLPWREKDFPIYDSANDAFYHRDECRGIRKENVLP